MSTLYCRRHPYLRGRSASLSQQLALLRPARLCPVHTTISHPCGSRPTPSAAPVILEAVSSPDGIDRASRPISRRASRGDGDLVAAGAVARRRGSVRLCGARARRPPKGRHESREARIITTLAFEAKCITSPSSRDTPASRRILPPPGLASPPSRVPSRRHSALMNLLEIVWEPAAWGSRPLRTSRANLLSPAVKYSAAE